MITRSMAGTPWMYSGSTANIVGFSPSGPVRTPPASARNVATTSCGPAVTRVRARRRVSSAVSAAPELSTFIW